MLKDANVWRLFTFAAVCERYGKVNVKVGLLRFNQI